MDKSLPIGCSKCGKTIFEYLGPTAENPHGAIRVNVRHGKDHHETVIPLHVALSLESPSQEK
jgi:hypothetical protein